MAKRKYSRNRMSKIEPAVMTITLATPNTSAGATSNNYFDLSQIASIVNRRFYRQGLNWAVAGFKFSSLQTGQINVSKLPNTWVTSNAWEKTFRLWNKQLTDTLEEAGNQSARARFSDFKIYADQTHRSAGVLANLLPKDASGNQALPGEWNPSHIVLPNTAADASGSDVDPTEYTLHMVGNDGAGGKGMIRGYQNSRSYPQSPDPVAPVMSSPNNWMSVMFDDGHANENILDNAQTENDELPYPQTTYPGGATTLPGLQWHDLIQIYPTSISTNVGIVHGKGGNFPCGLVRVDWTPSEVSANLVIQVDLVPGNHRGYLAEPMTEM